MDKDTKDFWLNLIGRFLFLITVAVIVIAIFWLIPESDRGQTLVNIFSVVFIPWKITLFFALLAAFFAGQLYVLRKRNKK
ncbi:MAG: hypothetical protein LBE12_19365 [Planctomycetaceae bacterium]|jgi:hypothetical protein|nr:hypothetical protein [Planctomycetaceae bacterium]